MASLLVATLLRRHAEPGRFDAERRNEPEVQEEKEIEKSRIRG